MQTEVLVVGGGVIGLSIARELSARGKKVLLIEKNKLGYGCSYGNAGWLTPCFAMPLPMPGLLLKSMKWMLDPEGPLYIKPEPSLLLMQWLLRFMSAMNERQATRAIEGLVDLSKLSLELYEKLDKDSGGLTQFQKRGLLMVTQTKNGLAAAKDEMNRVRPHQIPGQDLNAQQVKELEPAITGDIVGGVYFPNEAHAEPLGIVHALADQCRKQGVEILEDTELIHFSLHNKKVSAVLTTAGEIKADITVLATGSWSHVLAEQLQLNVPILGGKGYALIVPPLEKQPQIPLMLLEKKIAITPRQGSLRIAGTLELVNQDFSITQRRVKAIEKGARQFLSLPEKLELKELWRGLRPCTPDGLPLIGFSPKQENLYLACGHQMLGLQSGLGTGVYVADEICGRSNPLIKHQALFTPARF
jgi:D-amino-acid dehydrogenase